MKKQNLILLLVSLLLVALVGSLLEGNEDPETILGESSPAVGDGGDRSQRQNELALEREEPEAREQASVAESKTSPATSKALQIGQIHGRVLDDLESPLGGCAVVIHKEGEDGAARIAVDAQGSFALTVTPGIYEVSVDRESLPDGFVGPFERAMDRVGIQGRYENQLVEVIPEHRSAEVVLHVFKSALIYGRVVDENDQPIEGATVYVSYAGIEFVPSEARGESETDVNGDFEVQVSVAGNYRLNVMCGLDEPLFDIAPPTLELTIECGGVYPVGTLRAGGDGITMTGRVLDQDGEPFVGAFIECYPNIPKREGWRGAYNENDYGRTRTDAEGRFILSDLPQATIRISTFGDWEKPLGERRVATWWTPIDVDLTNQPRSSTLDIGDHMTPESRPFYLTVHYEFDDDWYRAHDLPLRSRGHVFHVRFEPATPLPETQGMSHEEEFLAIGGRTLSIDDEDPLVDRWISDALPGPYVLRIRAEDGLFDPAEYAVEIYPNGSRELTVQIPPN
jgi:hypothetical protein